VYRDFILVNYITSKINLKNNTNYPTINNIAPDSWIYLQDNGVTAGRLDIMNNFSPYMVKNYTDEVVINLEYFCNENDKFWCKSDDEIIKFGVDELKNLNVIDNDDIKTAKVIRIKKAYPSYFGAYDKFDALKNYINSLDNLLCVGRNGQHKYNNMDHSVLSGIIAARIILQNSDKTELWNVNTDPDYQEIKTK
jgi:protoporphyrinogen oxidase